MREPAAQPTATRTRVAIPAVGSLTIDPERLERIWEMSAAQRTAAAQAGQLTLGEMLRWAGCVPHEVPLLGGEFFFITALSADSEASS